jgi:hypothetical protein
MCAGSNYAMRASWCRKTDVIGLKAAPVHDLRSRQGYAGTKRVQITATLEETPKAPRTIAMARGRRRERQQQQQDADQRLRPRGQQRQADEGRRHHEQQQLARGRRREHEPQRLD